MCSTFEEELEIVEKENDELLISLVKERPWIYDKSLKAHSDKVVIENSWIEISSLMHDTEDNCLKRWEKLKKEYAKELSLLDKESRSGSGASHRKKWPFFDSMKNIFDRSTTRVCKSNLSSHKEESKDTKSSNFNSKPKNLLFARKQSNSPFLSTFQKAESVLSTLVAKCEDALDSKKPLSTQNINSSQQNKESDFKTKKRQCMEEIVGDLMSAKLHKLNPVDAKKKRKEITRFLANFESSSDEDDNSC